MGGSSASSGHTASQAAGLVLVDALARGDTSGLDKRTKHLLQVIAKDPQLMRKLARAVKQRKQEIKAEEDGIPAPIQALMRGSGSGSSQSGRFSAPAVAVSAGQQSRSGPGSSRSSPAPVDLSKVVMPPDLQAKMARLQEAQQQCEAGDPPLRLPVLTADDLVRLTADQL